MAVVERTPRPNTPLQFAGETVALPTRATEARLCPTCASRFSGADARFCPFDGEPLEERATWDPSNDPLIDSVVDGRYRVVQVLGEGGMGTVYEVKHVTLERRLAMKVMRAELANERELATRFTREARAAAAVSHPNVVQITDFGSLATGQPYFTMELLSGQPLSLENRDGPLPAARVVRIAVQIARALEAAHRAGVIHRDLKPDNVVVSSSDTGDLVKVVDFGLAKVAGQSRLTKSGMVFGTPHYMSPEQAMGGQVDHRSDMYALGVVLYEMLTGRVPFEADTFMGVMTKHMYVSPTPLRELVREAELGALEDLTLRCLEKKPERRFGSMAELIEALENAGNVISGRFVANPRKPAAPAVRSVLNGLPEAGRISIPGLQKPARWPVVIAVSATLFGFAVLAGWGLHTSRAPARAPAASAAPPSETAGRVTSAAASPLTPPIASPSAVSAPVGASASVSAASPPRASAAPRTEPARGPGALGAPAAATNVQPAKIKRQFRSGEIIDPWSQ